MADPAKQAANRRAVLAAYDTEMSLHDPNKQPDEISVTIGDSAQAGRKDPLPPIGAEVSSGLPPVGGEVSDHLTPPEKTMPDPMTALHKATGIIPGAEPTFLHRAEAAIGPAIRGAGDVTGANWLLERTGLVPQGRLSGPEANDLAEHTRFTTGLGGVASLGIDAVGGIANAAKSGLIPAAYQTVRNVAPFVKYEAAKYGLEKIGVPGADLLAFLIAGGTTGRPELRRGGLKRIGEPDVPTPRTDAVATGTGTPAGPPPEPTVTWGGAPVESPFRPITPPAGGSTGTGTPAAGPVPGGPPTTGPSVGPLWSRPITVEPPPPAAAAEPPPATEPPATEVRTPTERDLSGAERVGRATGRTIQEVRDAEGPSPLGEAPGAPKPKVPTRIVKLFTDKLRGMPVGGPERQAYVDAAKDPLTRGRVDATRETLEHLRARFGDELPKILEQLGPNPSAQDILNLLKLGIPAAVGTRLALLNGMRPGASHDQPSQSAAGVDNQGDAKKQPDEIYVTIGK